jgi:hypothetical protein
MRIYLAILCLLGSSIVLAQNEDFASDRPGLSDSPDLIEKNSWQIASGFDISKYNHYGIYQLSNNTLKYGINKLFEARLDFAFQYDPEQKLYGITSPALGIKSLLFRQNKWLPKTAFIFEYYPPPFSSTQQPSGMATEICLSYNYKNGNDIYYNIGTNWIDINAVPTLNSLIGFSYEFSEKTSTFIELYLYKTSKKPLNYVSDIGITYQLNDKFQIDFSAGLDLIKPKGNLYFEGGITYNF